MVLYIYCLLVLCGFVYVLFIGFVGFVYILFIGFVWLCIYIVWFLYGFVLSDCDSEARMRLHTRVCVPLPLHNVTERNTSAWHSQLCGSSNALAC